MKARHFLLAILLLSSTLAPTTALAQNADADKATARDLAIEGYKALQSKDYAVAVDRFTRADALYHAPTVILGLARAYVGLGKLVSAQELYSRIAHESLPPNASSAIKKAVLGAEKELDALTPRIPSVVINVWGNDAPRVTLDGIEVRAAALGVKRPVDPGKHVIIASATGFAASEVTVNLTEGKSESVTLELKPRQAEPPPVVAVAPAVKPAIATPVAIPAPPTPPVSEPALREPEPGQTASARSMQKTLGFSALGVGSAGLVVGVVAGCLALSKHGDIAKSCPGGHCSPSPDTALQTKIDSYNAVGAISTVGFIAGGAVAVTGMFLLLTDPRAELNQETFGFVVGGVGIAGLLAGAVTGGIALSKHGDIAKSCPDGHCSPSPDTALQTKIESCNTMGTISTTSFIAGGAFAATGVVLMLTAPKVKPNQTAITPILGLGFVGAEGKF